MIKRGLSEIAISVFFIILILVGVLLVVFLPKNIDVEEGEDNEIRVKIDIKNVIVNDNNLDILLKRKPGAGEMIGVKLTFKDSKGLTETIEKEFVVSELEEKKITIALSKIKEGDVEEISVAPIFVNDMGLSVTSEITDTYKIIKTSSVNNPTGNQNYTNYVNNSNYTNFTNGNFTDSNNTNNNQTNQSQCTPTIEICGNSIDEDCSGADLKCVDYLKNTYKDSLVSWWRFEGDADDELGRNDGSCTSCPTDITGKYGQAYSFDGVNDYVSFGSSTNLLKNINSATISVWVKPYTLTTDSNPFDISTGTSLGSRFQIVLKTDGNIEVSGRSGDSENIQRANTNSVPIIKNKMSHIVAVIDYANDDIRIYIDGIEQTTTESQVFISSSTSDTSPQAVYAGVDSNGISGFFNGTIDEVMIFNKSLSAIEIQEIYGMNLGYSIKRGDNWRYFEGYSNPLSGWNSYGFDDSSWPSGQTGIGYGDNDDTTVINMQNNYVTLYTRKNFTVNDASSATGMSLTLDYDDSFVAYINGQEILRDRVPSGQNYATTASSSHEAGTPEFFDLSGELGKLRNGENVLAVEIHNKAISSSDLSLIPEFSINF